MSTGGYIQLPLVGDVDSLTETGKDYMESSLGPNWVANPGNPDTVLIEGSGQIAGELIDQAATVPPEALMYIGTSIYGLPTQMGSRAGMSAVITWSPTAGAVSVPAGSEVAVPHPSGGSYIFTTDADNYAPPGGGDVPVNLIALDVGEEQNGSFGASDLVDAALGVSAIVAQPASGGTDDEQPADYLNRLTQYLTLPRRPVLPEDHVTLALQTPGVGRATAYNLYYPGTTAQAAGLAIGDFDKWTPPPAPAAAQTNVARCTTVVITGDAGAAPSTDLMNAVYLSLDANREVNFLNFVMKPVYVGVDVQAVITPYAGTTKADAIAAARASAQQWLSPDEWNASPGVVGGVWNADTKVRINEAIDWLNRGGGVWYVDAVKLKFSTDSVWLATDLDLTPKGFAVIPTYGTLDLT